MHTIRQVQRFWDARQYDRLAREMLRARPENSERLAILASRPVPGAALALVRLDELSLAQHPLNQELIRTILAAQESDGGWGDPLTTALCLRALRCNSGGGLAIERGMHYLSLLQKTSGIWPGSSVRRTAEDPFGSAVVLYCLGEDEKFRSAARLEEAMRWFEENHFRLDGETARLWQRAQARCRINLAPAVSVN